jgi:transcriptional regulator with XRE-family HTH domain
MRMAKVKATGDKGITKRLNSLKGCMSLRSFADQCGINQNTMHNYLHGRKLDESVIKKVCKTFGKSSDWLLGLKPDSPIDEASTKLKILANEVKADQESMNKILKDMGV